MHVLVNFCIYSYTISMVTVNSVYELYIKKICILRALQKESNCYLTTAEPTSTVIPAREVMTSYDLKHSPTRKPASKNISSVSFLFLFKDHRKKRKLQIFFSLTPPPPPLPGDLSHGPPPPSRTDTLYQLTSPDCIILCLTLYCWIK